ncbi:Imm21 family immunity protein [Streptomyces griseorubiginosus]|uniref:Imm21 family immunity protein n=1 Tax=Streptomyces griseorubiginosus TaxID=67304 RepID=UPI003F541D44
MSRPPPATCYLPEHRAFLRWLAADSDAELKAAAETVLRDPTVPLVAGSWRVRAVHTKAGEHNWVGLVQLLPIGV